MDFDAKMKRLASVDPGMISDSMARLGLHGWMDGIHALGAAASFAGPARTIQIGPKRGTETLAISKYAFIEGMAPGEVLVVGGYETIENQLGCNVALFAQTHGAAAVVCETPVRDLEEMAARTMPVFSRGVTARLPVSTDSIAADVAINCAGAQVRPGDIVVGSRDGIIVIPRSRLDDLLYQLEDIEEVEERLQAIINGGKSSKEVEAMLNIKKKLRAGSPS